RATFLSSTLRRERDIAFALRQRPGQIRALELRDHRCLGVLEAEADWHLGQCSGSSSDLRASATRDQFRHGIGCVASEYDAKNQIFQFAYVPWPCMRQKLRCEIAAQRDLLLSVLAREASRKVPGKQQHVFATT